MKFRLTTGENGTAFGKQKLVHFGEAKNALEFVKAYFAEIPKEEWENVKQITWVDAGNRTIPIAVANLKF